MPESLKIEVTRGEAQVLLNLIDTACKALGVQSAASCLLFVNKIQEAANRSEETTKSD